MVLVSTMTLPVYFTVILPLRMREGAVLHGRRVIEATIVGGQVPAVEPVTTELSLFLILCFHLD